MQINRWLTAGTVAAVLLPTLFCMAAAYWVSEYHQRARVATLASLGDMDLAEPCGDLGLKAMRTIDLGSSLLQGVGYAVGNELLCSSVNGRDLVELGVPDFTSATGQNIRRRSDLEFAPGVPLLVVSNPAGFTAFVHPSLIFDLMGSQSGEHLSGIANYSRRTELLASRENYVDWSKVPMPVGQMHGTVVIADQLVEWQRSSKWDQFSFASVPWSAVLDEFWELCRYLAPVGLVTGVCFAWLMRRLEDSRSSLPALLRQGLRRGEIMLVYQPIVDMRTGHWVGAEVLSRWLRRSGEWISPDIFIPLAEKHGLIAQLTRFVVARAVADMSGFLTQNPDLFLSINVSSADLQGPDFAEFLLDICTHAGIATSAIHLEITERQQVDQGGEASVISNLRKLGFVVGVDDFGVGYSNLAYLDNLELDYLKIDRVFVANAMRAGAGVKMVDQIIDVAAARDLTVIAEGVEREAQRDYLLARGVMLAQGWLYAKGMSALDFRRGHAAARNGGTIAKEAA